LGCITISFNIAAIAAVVPVIGIDLGIPDFEASKIIPYYLMPYGIGALIYAPLTRFLTYRTVLATTMALFAITCYVCGSAQTLGSILVARVLMGVTAASAIPLGLMIIGELFAKSIRGRLVGGFFSCAFIASLAGIALSGIAHWRWLFFVPAALSILLAGGFLIFGGEYLGRRHVGHVNYLRTLKNTEIRNVFVFIFAISFLYHGVHKWYGVYLSRVYGFDQFKSKKADKPKLKKLSLWTADKADEILGKLNAARQKSMAIGHLIESLKRKQAELETTLDYCMIRSPFDGLVSLRLVDPGDLAVPGKDLMVVEDRSGLKLSFDVPQQDLPQVHEGLEVGYSIGGHARKATLSHLFPSLNVARMLRAEVYLDGAGTEGLSSGAYVPLQVVHGNIMNATLIPAASVIDSPDGQLHVFVANGGRLEARQIRVLGSSEDDVAVENVMEGEQVVLSTFLGWAPLSSGQKVEVVK
ncbi:MAG: MFS transporter, partial [Planctomycetota bacterium]|nr:MFS transporter [Planctomycetota bacterium]